MSNTRGQVLFLQAAALVEAFEERFTSVNEDSGESYLALSGAGWDMLRRLQERADRRADRRFSV